MSQAIQKIIEYFQFPFVRYAFITGVLIALCSSLLGVTLVLRRFSFIGDGLSHVAFGAMAVAAILNLTNEMSLILPVTVICAVLLLRTGQNTKIKGDAAVAMISVGALAIGYLLMNVFSTSSNLSGDVCTTLFGSTSILTLTKTDVWVCAILSIIVVAVYIIFYNRIFAVTFDENFATATGTRTGLYNLLLAVIIAVIIVLAMNLVGSLLISALVIFPAISAMRIFKSFRSVTICSALLSVTCAAAGLLISILAGTPVGSTIVAADIAAFFICSLIGHFHKSHAHVVVTAALLCLFLFTGCGSGNAPSGTPSDASGAAQSQVSAPAASPQVAAEADPAYDLDLTALNEVFASSEIFQMQYDSSEYDGMSVKVRGLFDIIKPEDVPDVDLTRNYYYVSVFDGCCTYVKLEFVLPEGVTYPDNCPEAGSTITVGGTFEPYKEGNNSFSLCHLVDCEILEVLSA